MLINLFNLEMPTPKEIDEAINKKFVSKEKFAEDIEKLVLETKMNYKLSFKRKLHHHHDKTD